MGAATVGDSIRVAITFDVDLCDYHAGGADVDEFADAVPRIVDTLRRNDVRCATWFVRLDDHVEARYGRADFAVEANAALIRQLIESGHDVGWHPHAYVRDASGWRQNTDGARVAADLCRWAPAARSHGFRTVRMGWCFHTNETMAAVEREGFLVDSSALPRPNYAWDDSGRDWTVSPNIPYWPSVDDYRKPGEPARRIVEVPLSLGVIAAPYDRDPVLRYFNLAYRPDMLRPALEEWCGRYRHLVTVGHPYEFIASNRSHPLIAFDPTALDRNLAAIRAAAHGNRREVDFVTISSFVT